MGSYYIQYSESCFLHLTINSNNLYCSFNLFFLKEMMSDVYSNMCPIVFKKLLLFWLQNPLFSTLKVSLIMCFLSFFHLLPMIWDLGKQYGPRSRLSDLDPSIAI